MALKGTALKGSSSARPFAFAGGLAVLLSLGGCFGSSEPGTAPASTPWGSFLRGSTEEPKEIDPASYQPINNCPPLTLRPGTETHVIMKGPVGDPKSLGFQASITDTARECSFSGNQISLKVGVAGRLLAGRKGGATSGSLPVRIAVVKDGDKPIFSKLYNVPVSIAPPATAVSWATVQDITVPTEGTLRIYVGFDDQLELSKRPTAAMPPPESASEIEKPQTLARPGQQRM